MDPHYISIPNEIIVQDSEFTFSIYIHLDSHYAAFIPKGIPVDEKKLALAKNKKIFILESDIYAYQESYKKFLETLDSTDRTLHIKREAFSTITKIFESNDTASALQAAVPVMENLVNFITSVPGAISNLLQLSSHSYYTYNHSVNVAVYTLSLCMKAVKTLTKDEMRSIALGGFLHDIGKSKVPLHIINKPDKLTEEEWSIMKKHPEWGYEMVKNEKFCDAIVGSIILQHHENFNGTGYPGGLEKEQIHPFAQICAVADSYDAMTNKRVYAKQMTGKQALDALQRSRGSRYNPKFLNLFSTKGDYTTE